ncbi:hypothetical protein H5410_011675, partial [Solanum commersonii]
ENSIELLQRFRRDRRILLNFILSGSLIKKVVIPPELFPWMMWILIKLALILSSIVQEKLQILNYWVCLQEDYPRLSLFPRHHQFCQHSPHHNQLTEPFEELSSLSKSQSLSSTQQQEFNNAATDLVLGLSSFA